MTEWIRFGISIIGISVWFGFCGYVMNWSTRKRLENLEGLDSLRDIYARHRESGARSRYMILRKDHERLKDTVIRMFGNEVEKVDVEEFKWVKRIVASLLEDRRATARRKKDDT